MNIRTRLTLIFSMIVIFLLTGVSIAIYFFSADYREDDFYQRLKNKANNTAKLLIEVDEVDAELLKRIERSNPSNLPMERIIIYDFKNSELYSSDVDDEINVDQSILDAIRLQKEIRFRQGEFEVLGFLFTEKFDRITVVAAAVDIYGLGKLRNLRTILLLIFGISMVIIPISGWIYAGRMLSPIANLVKQTEAISANQLDRRLQATNTTDEFGQLVRTFNFMLTRLEQAFLAQKHFISNASHELRTPLTSMTGEIEVTLLQPRSIDKYQDVLKSVLEEIKNLSLISNQLLMLAQTSSDSSDQKLELNRIDEILWQAKDEILKNHPDYRIDIELNATLDEDLLTIPGDEQLLKTAFSNLMDNGCKYSSNKAVVVRLKEISHAIDIEFENIGIGIEPSDLTSIFQPFYRGKNTRAIKGHGIGLSLVHRIVGLHKGKVSISSDPGKTTLFKVTLPAA